MMNDRKEFVLAVIVALIVPIVIGTMYFFEMTKKMGSNEFIAKLADVKELALFGRTAINETFVSPIEDKDYINGSVLDFEVDYASGKDEIATYEIELMDIKSSQKIDFISVRWRLLKYDEQKEKFESIATGNFSSDSDEIVLIENERLLLKDSHKYRLYYYINRDIGGARITARLRVE